MLYKMAFCLSGKVVALHLDSSTAKTYLHNQGVEQYLFSRLTCQRLNLADKHGITLISTCIPSHLYVEAKYLSQ